MEIGHWRMRSQRYKLTGFKRESEDGTVLLSINGSNWVESQNGFHRHENPKEGAVIYQAPHPASDNGREPKKNQGLVEISASSG